MINPTVDNIIVFWVTFIHLIFLVIVISNYIYSKKTNRILLNNSYQPGVDILIPARNEEKNIKNLVNSILRSDYRNYRIFILDDNSNDRTKIIVEELEKEYSNLKLIEGKPLPDGWLGKNWACHQLALKAGNDYLLFMDADVTISPDSISIAISIMNNKEADLLSIFPSQKVGTFGEALVVPLMDWLLLTFLPLQKVYKSPKRSLSAANGQFMLFRTEAYKKSGGHEKLKGKIVEDIEFARSLKSIYKRVIILPGNNKVNCRMYNGFPEAVSGFVKNLYPGFGINPILYAIIMMLITALFLFPFVLMFFSYNSILTTTIILIQRFFSSLISKQNPVINILLFPFHIMILAYISIRSLILTKQNKVIWKDRSINQIA